MGNIDLCSLLYVVVTTYTVLNNKKPWYYGYSEGNKNLKSPVVKFGLPLLYGIHTCTVVSLSLKFYSKLGYF